MYEYKYSKKPPKLSEIEPMTTDEIKNYYATGEIPERFHDIQLVKKKRIIEANTPAYCRVEEGKTL